MTEIPGWIQILYKRLSAEHALHTAFLHDLARAEIAEMSDAQPNGRRHLRETALNQLAASDPAIVAISLVFLGVVGESEDLKVAVELLNDTSDVVQRAARACKFALEH